SELGQTPGPSPSEKTRPVPRARSLRQPVTPFVEQLLQLIVSSPQLAQSVSPEHLTLLDAPEMAPVVELIVTLQKCAIVTPAMLVEVTRESQYNLLYQDVSARMLTETVDDETARAMLSDALLQLERPRIEAEYQRLLASDHRNE